MKFGLPFTIALWVGAFAIAYLGRMFVPSLAKWRLVPLVLGALAVEILVVAIALGLSSG